MGETGATPPPPLNVCLRMSVVKFPAPGCRRRDFMASRRRRIKMFAALLSLKTPIEGSKVELQKNEAANE